MKKRIVTLISAFLFLFPVLAISASPARFVNGATNVASTTALGQYLAMDPSKTHTFYNEMYIYLATEWTLTTTEAGGGSATEAIEDEDGGVLLITNAAGNDDLDFFQTVDEMWTFETGKKVWFKARFKVSDATESDFIFGFQIRDTTALAVSDGVWFQKDDTDTQLDFHVAKASVQSDQNNIATISDDTYLTVGFYYNGSTKIQYFVNDALAGTVTTSAFPTTELTLSFGIQNGEAVAKTMSVDYIMGAKER